MRPTLALSFFLLAAACQPRSAPPDKPETPVVPGLSKVVMGYYPSWKKAGFDYTKIRYQDLTHIAHAFTWPDSSGRLMVGPEYLYPELVAEAHRRGVKVLMSVGGWGNSAGFPGTAASAEARTRFTAQVLDFLMTYGYDGVDIDWEFVSNPSEQRDFVVLIKELSSALKAQSPPLLLTMAVPSGDYWGRWINYEEAAGSFDFIGCMTYDFHGEWSDHSGHNSPLYSCGGDPCGSFNDSYLYLRSRGVPSEKLLLGLPFFGRSFDSPDLYGKFRTSLDYGFGEVMGLRDSGWAAAWDDCAQVPFLRKPDQSAVLSYDDEKSAGLKCAYVIDINAAGLIIWELSQDEYQGESVLLKTVGEAFAKTE